jgi:phage shock protein PspC (stress-responsive transcriptional regulator)
MQVNFRLYRSRDRVVAGVAGGVADALDVDPSIVRIVWALAMFAGLPLLLYIVMAIVVPEEPDDWQPWTDRYGTSRAPEPRSTPAGVYPATPETPAWTPAGTAASPTAAEGSSADVTSSTGPATFDTELNASAGPAPEPATSPEATTSTWTAAPGPGAVPAPGGVPGPAPAFGPTPAPGHDSWRASHWAEREARRAERRAERWERRAERHNGSGAIVFGLILILLGAGFLARQLVPNLDWDQIWPVGLIAIGGLLLAGALTRRPQP